MKSPGVSERPEPHVRPEARAHLRAVDGPDVLAVCRWLPQPFPSGAFSGRHDRVHINNRHGLVNLWWEDTVVHQGHYVGPPRGGLAADPGADYSVAMPGGGYLHVEAGVATAWSDTPGPDQVIRADGESFHVEDYSAERPYFAWQYQSMTLTDCRRAILGVQRQRLSRLDSPSKTSANQSGDPRSDIENNARSLLQLITDAQATVVCDCGSPRPDHAPEIWPFRDGSAVPSALLRHASAMAIMAGAGNPDDAIDVVWRLTTELADPIHVGLVQAAEAAARRLDSSVAGLPDAPLTEEAVALVAAQAVRWHGAAVVPHLPFWTLGWIFLARPLLEHLESGVHDPQQLQQALGQADRIRVERASQVWKAAHDAATGLAELAALVASDTELRPSDIAGVVDLRVPIESPAEAPSQSPPAPPAPPVPMQRTSDTHSAYSQDIATVLAQYSAPSS